MDENIEEKIRNYKSSLSFKNPNQTQNCIQNYLDYHRCNKALAERGIDIKPCQWYYKIYKELCPNSWVERWDKQIEDGNFGAKI